MIAYDSGEYHLSFIFRWSGSLLPRAVAFSMPSVAICLLTRLLVAYELRPLFGDLEGASPGLIWSVSFFTLTFLVGFRCNQAYSRFWEGCVHLQQMSAEWFESASTLVAFTTQSIVRSPHDPELQTKVRRFHAILVRLLSLLHGVALHQISGGNQDFDLIDVWGLDDESLDYIARECAQFEINRAEVVLHWIQLLITDTVGTDVNVVPAPIVSRCYQTLSRGMVHLHRIRNIAEIPFPFPLSQALAVMLIFHGLFSPVLVASYFDSIVCAVVMTFMPSVGMWFLMFVCGQLEQPFGTDANDLPLRVHQFDFNNSLLMTIAANKVPTIMPTAPTDAEDLRGLFGDPDSSTLVLSRDDKGGKFRDLLRGEPVGQKGEPVRPVWAPSPENPLDVTSPMSSRRDWASEREKVYKRAPSSASFCSELPSVVGGGDGFGPVFGPRGPRQTSWPPPSSPRIRGTPRTRRTCDLLARDAAADMSPPGSRLPSSTRNVAVPESASSKGPGAVPDGVRELEEPQHGQSRGHHARDTGTPDCEEVFTKVPSDAPFISQLPNLRDGGLRGRIEPQSGQDESPMPCESKADQSRVVRSPKLTPLKSGALDGITIAAVPTPADWTYASSAFRTKFRTSWVRAGTITGGSSSQPPPVWDDPQEEAFGA